MKLYCFAALIALCTVPMIGCGGKAEKNSSDPDNASKQAAKTAKANEGNSRKENAKPARINSTLPFKDLDIATASKGIDPGRILIDVNGKDSAGKKMALSDYKGKVILLDTWASW